MQFPNAHENIDRANLQHDRAVAAALRQYPELIEVAQENLARWARKDGESIHPALAEWQDILFFLRPDQVADFLESETPKANRLRQSSPFIGILRRAAELEKQANAKVAA
jgi:hypothetical protein